VVVTGRTTGEARDGQGVAAELASTGEDPCWAYAYSSLFDSVREQRWASVSDEVARLTGKPATTVRAVLAEQRSARIP
jgi:hypothetical protein